MCLILPTSSAMSKRSDFFWFKSHSSRASASRHPYVAVQQSHQPFTANKFSHLENNSRNSFPTSVSFYKKDENNGSMTVNSFVPV